MGIFWPVAVLHGLGFVTPPGLIWPGTVYPVGYNLAWHELCPGLIWAGVNLARYIGYATSTITVDRTPRHICYRSISYYYHLNVYRTRAILEHNIRINNWLRHYYIVILKINSLC